MAHAVYATMPVVKRILCVLILLFRLCATNIVVQDYIMMKNDSQNKNYFFLSLGTSLVECCGRCQRHAECRSISYHRDRRACQLSSKVCCGASDPSPGWQMYARKYDCPDSGKAFALTGNTHLSVCPTLVSQPHARAACQQFGNLVKVDTATKQEEVMKFLFPISETPGHYKSTAFWVDGMLNSQNTTWFFHDHVPMPSEQSKVWANGQPDLSNGSCARIITDQKYQLASGNCSDEYGYICEKP